MKFTKANFPPVSIVAPSIRRHSVTLDLPGLLWRFSSYVRVFSFNCGSGRLSSLSSSFLQIDEGFPWKPRVSAGVLLEVGHPGSGDPTLLSVSPVWR